jgi:hypothetical protein
MLIDDIQSTHGVFLQSNRRIGPKHLPRSSPAHRPSSSLLACCNRINSETTCPLAIRSTASPGMIDSLMGVHAPAAMARSASRPTSSLCAPLPLLCRRPPPASSSPYGAHTWRLPTAAVLPDVRLLSELGHCCTCCMASICDVSPGTGSRRWAAAWPQRRHRCCWPHAEVPGGAAGRWRCKR